MADTLTPSLSSSIGENHVTPMVSDIIQEFTHSSEPIFPLFGLCIQAVITNLESVVRYEHSSIFENLLKRIYDISQRYCSIPCASLYEKYQAYIPDFEMASPSYVAALSRIQSEELTNFDIRSIFNIIAHEVFNSLPATGRLAKTVKDAIVKSDTENLILPKLQQDKFPNNEAFKSLSNSERYIWNTYWISKDIAEYWNANSQHVCRSSEIQKEVSIRERISAIIQKVIFGPINNVGEEYYLWSILGIMQYLLIAAFNVGISPMSYAKFITNKDISESTNKLSDNARKLLLNASVFFIVIAEKMLNSWSRYDGKKINGNAEAQLALTKDYVLKMIQIEHLGDVDVVNHVYQTYKSHPAIKEPMAEKFYMGDMPFSQIENDCFESHLLEKEIDKIIDAVKRIRKSDKHDEYFDEITGSSASSFIRNALNFLDNWTHNPHELQDNQDDTSYQKYRHIWNSVVNMDGYHTVFGDSSKFGYILTLSDNRAFKFGIGYAVKRQLKSFLMTQLLNAHIQDELTLNWVPDTILLLNLYISYIASLYSNMIGLDESITFGSSEIVDVFNLCGKLNYRSYRTPQFKYQKTQNAFPTYSKSYHPKHLLEVIEPEALKSKIFSDDAGKANIILQYIGDAILNNAMNSEYAILILAYFERCYGYQNAFTKITRYMLSKVGGFEGDFYSAFSSPEIADIFTIFGVDNVDDNKEKIALFEKHLELHVFIAILQRILINLDFNDQPLNVRKKVLLVQGVLECGAFANMPKLSFGDVAVSFGSSKTAIQDIKSAMGVFDQTFNGSRKHNDWFEQHKELLVD